MKKLLAALFVALSTVASLAQPAILQSGSVTPGHALRWISNGVAGDGGSAASPVITSLGTVGSGPTICAQSAATSSGNYNRLCLGVTNSRGTIEIDNIGTATGGLVFSVNGVAQGLPTINLPATAGDAVCFLNNGGVLTDCGAPALLSVFGRTGAVTAQTGDYGVAQVTGAAPLASPTFTGTVNNSGTGYTSSNAAGPLISNVASTSSVPTLIPDKANSNSGIGGAGGNVAIVSNGVGVANFSSSGGATVSTPTINSNNTQIATTAYADRAPALKLSNNSSVAATFSLIMTPTDGVTVLADPPPDGQVVDFTAPVPGTTLKIGSGAAHPIYTPDGTGQVIATALQTNAGASPVGATAYCDICQNRPYRLRWVNSGSYWQLLTPPDSKTRDMRPTINAYYQTTGTHNVTITFQAPVYDPDDHVWKYLDFINTPISVDTHNAYLDGLAGQSLPTGHMYFAYIIIPSGQGGLTPTPTLSFVSRYFDKNYGGTESGSILGSLVNNTLTITAASFNYVATGANVGGMLISCNVTGCVPGMYIDISGCTTLVAGGTCLVHGNGLTTVNSGAATGFQAGAPKYFPVGNGPLQFVDGFGNIGTLIGQQYVPTTDDLTSYFGPTAPPCSVCTGSNAYAGEYLGNKNSSHFMSGLPQQRLTATVDPTPVTGQKVGSVPVGSLAELFPGTSGGTTRMQFVSWDWEPINDYRPRVVYTCTNAGASARLQIIETPTWNGAAGSAIVFDQTQICPAANGTVAFDPNISWSWTDGHFLIQMFGSISAGTASFTAASQLRIAY